MLDARHVSYTYGAYRAVTDVSLTVEAGQLVALVGRNGAGKSTLLGCLAGWLLPTAGDVLVNGHSLRQEEAQARAELVLVPDTPQFYEALTAWEHLQFVAQARRIRDWKGRAESLLRRFGLSSKQDALPQAFSRGMRYKLALCMALLLEPRVLLLDEPFGPLDPLSADLLWQDLLAYCTHGSAVILTGHQLPGAAEADRYCILEDGLVLAEGSPFELRQSLGVADMTLDGLLRAALDRQDAASPDA